MFFLLVIVLTALSWNCLAGGWVGWRAGLPGLLIFQVKPKRGMLVIPANMHWQYFSLFSFLEQRVHHLQNEGLRPAFCIRDFRLHSQFAAQINLVVD
jgi:hypothetical protein